MEDLIDTVGLFPILNKKLIDLLYSLNESDFNRSTQFPAWNVKDICAHLLDTSIRRLAFERDKYKPLENPEIHSYDDLVKYVTAIADRWIIAFSGVSPTILLKLIDHYQNELYDYIRTLKPYDYSFFPVNWAGEEKSYNWFDIAREYTERWHHQMQIREALSAQPIYEEELYYPVLDTFMRALPYHYRDWNMKPGYSLCIAINGKDTWKWYLEWNNGIELKKRFKNEPNTTIIIEKENAWKIFTRWNDKSVYKVEVNGNRDLGSFILEMNCLIIKN